MRGQWKQAQLNMRAGSRAADARVGTLAREALATPEHSLSPQARRRFGHPIAAHNCALLESCKGVPSESTGLIYLVFSLWGSGPASPSSCLRFPRARAPLAARASAARRGAHAPRSAPGHKAGQVKCKGSRAGAASRQRWTAGGEAQEAWQASAARSTPATCSYACLPGDISRKIRPG